MKILYFADTRFPIERANGVQTMATCHALAARGHHVTLVTRPDSASPPRDPFAFYGHPRVPSLDIVSLDGPKGPRARRAQFLMAALRRASKTDADVVFTRDLGVAAFLLRMPSRGRRPIVYESHGIAPVVSVEMPRLLGQPDLEPSPQKLLRLDRRERRVWLGAAAYVTITRALGNELTGRYGPRERLFVVPDGVKAENTNGSVPGEHGQAPVAGYAGHLYPWKGVDIFVRALASASKIKGVIVGGHPAEADLARVKALVRDVGVFDRVTITGLVGPADVRAHLSAATMLVLPNTASAISERYTSPLKLFEYLAMGRPIIASNLASIREVLTHERTALLVAPGDASALADAMSRLAEDAALAGRLGAAARELAAEYSWDRRAERLEAALTAAVAG